MPLITVKIPADTEVPVSLYGEYIRLTQSAETLRFRIGNYEFEMEEGDRAKLPRFNSDDPVRIYNPGTGAITVKMIVGGVDVVGQKLYGEVRNTKAQTVETLADVAIGAGLTVEVLPADTTRREALISNLSSNVQSIRVGDSNTGAARGLDISPGVILTLNTSAAIHVYSPAAQSVGVAVVRD